METFDSYELVVRLDMMLAREKMSLLRLSEYVDTHPKNLSILKTGKGKAIKLALIMKICVVLNCKPSDLFEVRKKPDPPPVRL